MVVMMHAPGVCYSSTARATSSIVEYPLEALQKGTLRTLHEEKSAEDVSADIANAGMRGVCSDVHPVSSMAFG